MKFVDEFRDPAAARKLLAAIEHLAGSGPDHFKFMEVCGGHTHSIKRIKKKITQKRRIKKK